MNLKSPLRTRVYGSVEGIKAERDGAQELVVRVSETNETRLALNLTALNGIAISGDRVLLNTSAVDLGLGTGGLDLVIAVLREEFPLETPLGHLMKLRYTPHQHPVLAVESPESPSHDALLNFTSLEGLPVVCTGLHSQLPAVLAGAKWAWEQKEQKRELRSVYIMTDAASLPIALSRLVPSLKAHDLLTHTITAGHAFGGDFEAINLYSALAFAKEGLNADLIVVGQGAGNAGTETPLGFSGIDQGQALNAVASLGGTPFAVARLSFADPRPRHYGLSHHTRTVLEKIVLAPVIIPVPWLDNASLEEISDEIKALVFAGSKNKERHQVVPVRADEGLQALRATGIEVTTMGRSIEEDRVFFLSAAAAGVLGGHQAEARGFEKTR